METRNIKVTIEEAYKWYKSGDETLKRLALNAYTKNELISYHLKSTAEFISLYIPKDKIKKFKILAELSLIASFFNKRKEIEDNTRYFIGKNNKINCDFTNKLFDNIYIFKHINVYYPGIVYFNNKEDIRKAVSIIGEEIIKQLFNE